MINNDVVFYLFFFGLPVVLVIATIAIGVYFSRRGRRNKNASMMVCGITILAASIIVAFGLIWFVVAIMLNANTMARIGLLGLPALASVGTFAVATVFVSVALIYLWIKRTSFRTAGYAQLPNIVVVIICICILLSVSALAWEKHLGARWHMWPYTSLSSTTGNPLTLNGWNPRKEQSDTIILIDHENAPNWRVSFELSSMNSKGKISLRLDPTLNTSGDDIYHLIPFEPSSYFMTNDGKLERIE